MDMCYQCNIVHDESECPMCEAKEEIEALGRQLTNAEDEIKENKSYIEDLENDLNAFIN